MTKKRDEEFLTAEQSARVEERTTEVERRLKRPLTILEQFRVAHKVLTEKEKQ
jgi:hypothetical protein